MNLIIGNRAQLSYYFPDDYIRVSSRNFDFNQFKNQKFNRIFITFAEQRLIMDHEKLFMDVNVDATLKIIKFFLDKANYIIVYGTCELWNNIEGPININTNMHFVYSPYCKSKQIMKDEIRKLNSKKVIIIHPFNFNSPYRKKGFLFSKIFDSIINKKKITIGNTYFYRDITHPKHIVERSINAISDELVGSGRLIFVNDFIRDLYFHFDLNYDEYITEDYKQNTKLIRKIFYLDSNNSQYPYNQLLINTLKDIKKFMKL